MAPKAQVVVAVLPQAEIINLTMRLFCDDSNKHFDETSTS
jgi:hypothetical protein